MNRSEGKLLPLTDNELALSITVILVAPSEKFPQLKGKAVRPDLRDEARRLRDTLVEQLRRRSQSPFQKKSCE